MPTPEEYWWMRGTMAPGGMTPSQAAISQGGLASTAQNTAGFSELPFSPAFTTAPGQGGGGLSTSGGLMAFGMGMQAGQTGVGALLQLIRARQQAKLSRRTSKGLRYEALPFLGELVGLGAVEGKGGYAAQPIDPQIAQAEALLRSPKLYSDEDIAVMQAAARAQSPRFQALTGPATGRSLMKSLPVPSRYWEEVLQPRLSALAANIELRLRARRAAAASRAQRYQIGTQYVK